MSFNYKSVKGRIQAKWALFWKYGSECSYCHLQMNWRYLTIDHIHPISKGGSVNDINNMCLACPGCNWGKGSNWSF